MKYICKVFTPEFKQLVDKTIEDWLIEDNIKGYSACFKKLEYRSNLEYLWNNGKDLSDDCKEYYKSLGILEPQYTEIELDSKEVGYQSKPRVEWNGEIVKIDDIDEIFSYKRA